LRRYYLFFGDLLQILTDLKKIMKSFLLTQKVGEPKKCYSFLITRTNPASPIAPIAARGSMPDFVVGICVGGVVVAAGMFTCAALIGGTILTTYTEIA
jgi:hypothetical protein